MAQIRTKITLLGREISIVSPDSSEYIARVAMTLENKLNEMNNSTMNQNMLLTLTALNITDELLKTRDTLEDLREKSANMGKQLRSLELEQSLGGSKSSDSAMKLKLTELMHKVEELEAENSELKEMI